MKHQYYEFIGEKKHKILYYKKLVHDRNCTVQTNFGHKINFKVNI